MMDCWKCDRRIDYSNKGKLGLCADCWYQVKVTAGVVGFLIFVHTTWRFWGHAWMTDVGKEDPSFFILDYMIWALICSLALVAGSLLRYPVRFVWSWMYAVARLVFSGVVLGFVYAANAVFKLYYDRKQRLQEEDAERGLLAEVRKLNGQQLDSLLTEEYMKKQGWK